MRLSALERKPGISIFESVTFMLDVFARKKYRLFKLSLSLFVLPNPTIIRRIKEAMVNAMGVKIHAKRPAFPMMMSIAKDWVSE